MCWYRLRSLSKLSAIGFQFRQCAAEADLATQLPQALIGLRRGQQFQSSADGLSDAGAARLLSLLQQIIRDFDRDLSRRCHDHSIIPYSIPVPDMVFPPGRAAP